MKRTFSLLISIALLLTGGIASAATSEFYATPGEPYEETVTVTSVRVVDPDYVSFDEGDDIENNLWTRYYLEEHNLAVKYLWTVPEAGTYTEKVNMQMLGELPDFLKMNANQYEQALEAGLLADITEVYETYASPALKERMTLTGGGVLEAGSKDGKLYALVQETDWQSNSAPILFIRGDWMEKLSLEAPKSVEDLMNIARAFATQDPDGNGKDDTYGICIDQYYNLSYFFPMFNAYNGIWLEKEDGTYGYSSVQPEMREALQQMQTYYKNCYLTDDEKKRLCEVAVRVRPDFIKTSTGFGAGGATLRDVRLMKSIVGNEIGVKAAGGIRTLEDALAFIQAGATRIGTSAGVKLLQEFQEKGNA